jgi:hypothetical protein
MSARVRTPAASDRLSPSGLRGFVFADPDGNRIDVGQRL